MSSLTRGESAQTTHAQALTHLPSPLPVGAIATLVHNAKSVAIAHRSVLAVYALTEGGPRVEKHTLPGTILALADSRLGIVVAVAEGHAQSLWVVRGEQPARWLDLPITPKALVAAGTDVFAAGQTSDGARASLIAIDMRRRTIVAESTLAHTDVTLAVDASTSRVLLTDPRARTIVTLTPMLVPAGAPPMTAMMARYAPPEDSRRVPPEGYHGSGCCCVLCSPCSTSVADPSPSPSDGSRPGSDGAGTSDQPKGGGDGRPHEGQAAVPSPGGGTVVGNGVDVEHHRPGERLPCGRTLFWQIATLQRAGAFFVAADRTARNVALLSADMNLLSEWTFSRGGTVLLANEHSTILLMHVRSSATWVMHDVQEVAAKFRPDLSQFLPLFEDTKVFIGQQMHALSYGQAGAPASIEAVLLPVIESGQTFTSPDLSGYTAFVHRTLEAMVRDYYSENSFGQLNKVSIKVFGADIGPQGGPLQLPRQLANYFWPTYEPGRLELTRSGAAPGDHVVFDGRESLTVQATPATGAGAAGTLVLPFFALGLQVDLDAFPAQVKFLGNEKLKLDVTTPAGIAKTLTLTFAAKTVDFTDEATVAAKMGDLASYLDATMQAAEAAAGIAPRLFAAPKVSRVLDLKLSFGHLLVTFVAADTSANRLTINSNLATIPGSDPLGLAAPLVGTIRCDTPGLLQAYLQASALLAQEANPSYGPSNRILEPPIVAYDAALSRLTSTISIANRYGGPGAAVTLTAAAALGGLYDTATALPNSATTLNDQHAVRDLEDLLRDAYTAANDRLRQPGQKIDALSAFTVLLVIPIEPPTPKFGVLPSEMWNVSPLFRPFYLRGVEWYNDLYDRKDGNLHWSGQWSLVFSRTDTDDLNVSVICHELGHAIGFGDLYWQTGYRNDLAYMDAWAMMADDGSLSHHCGYHKLQANWIPDGAGTPTDYGRVFPVGLPDPAEVTTHEILLVALELWHDGLEGAARAAFGLGGNFPVAQLVWIDLGGDGATFGLIEARENAKNSAGALHFNNNVPGDGGIVISNGITWRTDERFAVNNFYRRALQLLNPFNILRNPGDEFDLAMAPELPIKGVRVKVIDRKLVDGDTEVYRIQVTRENAEFVDLYFNTGEPYYKSPDLWIDWWGNNQPKPENFNPDYPAGMPTDQGEPLYVPNTGAEPHWAVARIRNRGQVEARNVKLNFFYYEPPGGGDGGKPLNTRSRDGLKLIGTTVVNSVAGGDTPMNAPLRWDIPAGFHGHTCLMVEVEDYTIPHDTKGAALGSDDVWLANNHAQKNVDKYQALSSSPFAPIEFDFSVYNGGLTAEIAYLVPDALPEGMKLSVARYMRKIDAGATEIFHCKLELDTAVIRAGCENDRRFRLHAWRKDAESSARWGGVEYEVQPRERTSTGLTGFWNDANHVELSGKVAPNPGGGTLRIRLAFDQLQAQWITVPLTAAGTFAWSGQAPAGNFTLNAVARFEGNRKFGESRSAPADLKPPPPIK